MSYRADKQVIDTHTLTDTQTGAMTIPECQNWPRVIMYQVNMPRTVNTGNSCNKSHESQNTFIKNIVAYICTFVKVTILYDKVKKTPGSSKKKYNNIHVLI